MNYKLCKYLKHKKAANQKFVGHPTPEKCLSDFVFSIL